LPSYLQLNQQLPFVHQSLNHQSIGNILHSFAFISAFTPANHPFLYNNINNKFFGNFFFRKKFSRSPICFFIVPGLLLAAFSCPYWCGSVSPLYQFCWVRVGYCSFYWIIGFLLVTYQYRRCWLAVCLGLKKSRFLF
jgi:hypothetical protein